MKLLLRFTAQASSGSDSIKAAIHFEPVMNTNFSPCSPARAANSVDFYIEFKFEFSLFYEFEFKFEFNIFIFASSSSAKTYQVLSSLENKVIDLA